MQPRRLRGLRTARVLGHEVPVADRRGARLLGLALLSRNRAGPGLLIPRCAAIHSFGMRFALDVLFLDEEGAPMRRLPALAPFRFASCRGAVAVLEMPSRGVYGARSSGTVSGEQKRRNLR